ncbi:hypothetical protein GGR57DRAFT_503819 [Xylariaceae sp. FL1272]|nr:hypothetical protein GGR57DRAFT_503819 [Xylariaceae sp. FL1272]
MTSLLPSSSPQPPVPATATIKQEPNFMESADEETILHTFALNATQPKELAAVKSNNTLNGAPIKLVEAAGAKAIVWTVDAPVDLVSVRHATTQPMRMAHTT